MSTLLTVRERIERRLVAAFGTMASVHAVHRFSINGMSTLTDSDVVVSLGAERIEEGGAGSSQVSTRTLDVEVLALVPWIETSSQSAAQLINQWLGELEEAAMDDPSITDSAGFGSERLAVDTRVTGLDVVPLEDGQERLAAMISLEVIYDTYRDSPYSGPGITERSDP